MKHILIYDDDPVQCELLKELLDESLTADHITDIATDMEQARELISSKDYYLVFLDIELENGNNGISAAEEIKALCPAALLVFITAYIKYAEDIFRVSPDALLLKPFTEEGVSRCLDIIRSRQSAHNTLALTKGKNRIECISVDDISVIETYSRQLSFFDSLNRPVYEFGNIKLSDIVSQLPSCFVRCHKSICVNMNFAHSLNRYTFVLKNGRTVPVSQSRFRETKDRFLEFLGDRL